MCIRVFATGLVSFLASFQLVVCWATTWYVDGSLPQSGNGRSWGTAFKTIQRGIDAAYHGDTVLVAAGTYLENVQFRGKNIGLRSTAPSDPAIVEKTVIDGNQSGPVVTFSGGEGETCVLAGFTIRNGRADYGGGICGGKPGTRCRAVVRNNAIVANEAAYSGGGLYACDGIVENNVITGNSAAGAGGGLYACGGVIRGNTISGNSAKTNGQGLTTSGPTLLNNSILNNSSGTLGGGLYDCDGDIRDNLISGNSANSGGGLALCDRIIQNNIISGNAAGPDGKGGGLYLCKGTIRDNVITGNSAYYGGALDDCDGTIQDNLISENSANSGGGLAFCDAVVQNNDIALNSAAANGGGIFYCQATISGNVISANHAEGDGGGLSDCYGTIHRNVILGNSAGSRGGGLSGGIADLHNNLIVGGSAGWRGGGIFNCWGTMINNTIVANSARQGGGISSGSAEIQNCIIWGNIALNAPQLDVSSEDYLVSYSCIQDSSGRGIPYPGPGNIAPPSAGFVDPDGPDNNPRTYDDNDYRLSPGSPCIDTGTIADWMFDEVDLNGNPRILFGGSNMKVDMGAYEYSSQAYKALEIKKGTSGRILLNWASVPGRQYSILSCADAATGPWEKKATVTSQAMTTFWIDSSPAGRIRFYRVEMVR